MISFNAKATKNPGMRLLIALCLATAMHVPGMAQTTPAPAGGQPAGSSPPPAIAAPPAATPEPPVQAPVVPAPPPLSGVPPAAVAPPPAATDAKPSGDASTAQVIDVQSRPVAMIRGSAKWDDGFKSLTDAFAKIEGELAKAGMKSSGRPLTVFVETDDESFRYEAMLPISDIPAGKDQLSAEVKFGKSPPGKAIKFQHRAAYEEIDSTYEAITAYLDEKGLEAQNLFIEEYLTDPKNPDDAALEVDIYVFIK